MSETALRGAFNARELFRLDKSATMDDVDPDQPKTHRFEAAGLGRAPYHVVGYREIANNCQFCGAEIVRNFIIEDARGYRFVVGTDCVHSTGDDGLIANVRLIEAKHRREKRESEAEQMRQQVNNLREQLTARREELRALPHRRGWKNYTLWDDAHWWMTNAGNARKAKELSAILELLPRR